MAILELVPATHDTISLLTQALELYKDSPDVSTLEIELEGGSMLPEKSNRQPVLESVPFSLGEFDEAWLEICAFEHDGHAFRPSSTFLAKVWKSMIAAATTLDIDIARGFRLTHLLEAMNDDGFPRNLIKAIMARTGLKNEGKMEDWQTLNRGRCVSWAGGVLLEAQSTSEIGVSKSNFLHEWRDQLPEVWRCYAKIGALECKYFYPSQDTIKHGSAKVKSENPLSAVDEKKGKWHEKFKDIRQ